MRPRIQFTKYLPWILFVLGVVYFAIAWLWKRAFVWGDSSGPYWLFVALDWTVLPMSIVTLLGFFAALAVWLVRLVRREPSARSAALPSGLLLLASLVFLGACFPDLISLITPLGSLRVRGRVYYLSDITALMDENYALFECDGVGLVCRQVYRSGDRSPAEPMQAELAYDDAANTLSIEVAGHGTIHIYRPLDDDVLKRGKIHAPNHALPQAALLRRPCRVSVVARNILRSPCSKLAWRIDSIR